jgi:phosphoglycolate phosphatase
MKLVIFDCDGTIVDSQAGIVLSVQHAFKSLRMTPPSREKTLSVVGLSLPEAFAVLAPEAESGTCSELAERYKSAFRELNRNAADYDILFPMAKEVVEALAARPDVMLGMATGKSRRGVDRLFEREGWHEHFVTIQTADDHPSKPHPSMILQAMRETDMAPSATIMIGDTTYDVEMARSAGAGAIGVAWGYHHHSELSDAGAHTIVDQFTALPDALERVIGELSRAA